MKENDLTGMQLYTLMEAAKILKVDLKDLLEMDQWIRVSDFIRKKDEDKGIFIVKSNNSILHTDCSKTGMLHHSRTRALLVAKAQACNKRNIESNNSFFVFKAIHKVKAITQLINVEIEDL